MQYHLQHSSHMKRGSFLYESYIATALLENKMRKRDISCFQAPYVAYGTSCSLQTKTTLGMQCSTYPQCGVAHSGCHSATRSAQSTIGCNENEDGDSNGDYEAEGEEEDYRRRRSGRLSKTLAPLGWRRPGPHLATNRRVASTYHRRGPSRAVG